MPKGEEVEELRKKLDEIDKKFSQLNLTVLAYIHAILALLDDKQVTHPQEFQEYLAKYKQDLIKRLHDADFLNSVEEQLKKKEKPE